MDLSIKKLEINTDEQAKDFLNLNVRVTVKYDGIKFIIAKQHDKIIMAYKDRVLYSSEFSDMETWPNGLRQLKPLIDRVLTNAKDMPDVAIFCEALISKPTLLSNYKTNELVAIFGNKVEHLDDKFGKLKLSLGDNLPPRVVSRIANLIGIKRPELVHIGKLGDVSSLKHKVFTPFKSQLKDAIANSNYIAYFNILVNAFRRIKSSIVDNDMFEEGVVITSNNSMFKIQQSYQFDRDMRNAKKSSSRLPDDDYREIKDIAKSTVSKLRPEVFNLDFERALAYAIKDIDHYTIRGQVFYDTLREVLRAELSKNMIGNKNALFVGKFRILTKSHYKIIKEMSNIYDNVYVAHITGSSKLSPESRDIVQKAITDIAPNVQVITAKTGNLFTIAKKIPIVSTLYVGYDRKDDYTSQAEKLGITIHVVDRNDNISATNIFNAIENDDMEYVKQNISPTLSFRDISNFKL